MFFYTIFYIVLGALFAICMKGLLMTCNNQSPKWTLHESIIGTNPGLGFRPISDDVEQGSLIWYDSSNQTQIKYWTRLLDDFMAGSLIIASVNNEGHLAYVSIQTTESARATRRPVTSTLSATTAKSANWTSANSISANTSTPMASTTRRLASS